MTKWGGIMPLDSKHNSFITHMSYEAKINLYDKLCSGCGFARITVGGKKMRSLEEALHVARATGLDIERECEYPLDVIEGYDGKLIYPSVHDIVNNSCRFWNNEEMG